MNQRKKKEEVHIFSSKGRPDKTLKLKLTKTETQSLQKFLPAGYSIADYTKSPKIQIRMPITYERELLPPVVHIQSPIPVEKVDIAVLENRTTEPHLQPEHPEPINPIETEYQVVKDLFGIIISHKFSSLLREVKSPNEEDEVIQAPWSLDNIQQKIESREIKNETELSSELRQLFRKLEETGGNSTEWLDKLDSLKAAYRKSCEKMHISIDWNDYALRETQRYSKKVENYAKGQSQLYNFQKKENSDAFLDFHSNFDDSNLIELIAMLPSIFRHEVYQKISSIRSSDQKPDQSIKEWIFKYCHAKLFQINPQRKNFKPSLVYRKQVTNQFGSKRVKTENGAPEHTPSFESQENISESSFLSEVDQDA